MWDQGGPPEGWGLSHLRVHFLWVPGGVSAAEHEFLSSGASVTPAPKSTFMYLKGRMGEGVHPMVNSPDSPTSLAGVRHFIQVSHPCVTAQEPIYDLPPRGVVGESLTKELGS